MHRNSALIRGGEMMWDCGLVRVVQWLGMVMNGLSC